MSNLMNAEAQTQQEKDRAESLEKTMAAGRSLWHELTIFAQNFAVAVTPIVDFLVAGFQKVNSMLATLKDSFIGLGEIIAFVFGTAALFKFMKVVRSTIDVQKLLTLQTWKEVAAKVALKSVGGPVAWGMLAASAAIAGGTIMALRSSTMDSHAAGTDSTSGRMALVGEEGPELIVPPQNSAVINNTTMTALAEQGAGGGGNNTQVVAAVQALGQKLDAVVSALNASGDFVMQVDDREFGRVINSHFGEPGYQKRVLRTA